MWAVLIERTDKAGDASPAWQPSKHIARTAFVQTLNQATREGWEQLSLIEHADGTTVVELARDEDSATVILANLAEWPARFHNKGEDRHGTVGARDLRQRD